MKLENFIKELQELEKQNPNSMVCIKDAESYYYHDFEIELDDEVGIVIKLD